MALKRKTAKAKRRLPKQPNDLALEELKAVKRLLVLQLMMSGVQTTDIATALGVNKSAVSKLVPLRKVKRKK